MNNPFSSQHTTNVNELPDHTKHIPKNRNPRKKIILGIIIVIIIILVISTFLLFKRITSYNAPANLSLEYSLAYGYKFNYSSNWKINEDSNFGLILTNSDGTTITISSAKINNMTLDQIIQSRVDALKNANLDLSTENVTINNINFRHIQMQNKTNENIVKPDQINAFATLKDDIYTIITVVNAQGKDITEAKQIVQTFRAY